MSDIKCAKCGEPWDSSGGLHYTHSDLTVLDYAKLVWGESCPCCKDSGQEATDETVLDWQKSIERLSEGNTEYAHFTWLTVPECRK